MRLRRQGEKDTLAELDKFREMQDQVDQQRRRRLEEMGVRTNERGLQERPRQETARREELMRADDGPKMAEPREVAPPTDEDEDAEPVAMDARRERRKIRKEVIPGMRAAWFRNWEQLNLPIISREFGLVHVDSIAVAGLLHEGAGYAVTDEQQVIVVRFVDAQGTIELSGPYGHENDPAVRLPNLRGVVLEETSKTPIAGETLVSREFIRFHLCSGREPATLVEAERVAIMFDGVRLPGAAPQAVETLKTALNRMRLARGGARPLARDSPPRAAGELNLGELLSLSDDELQEVRASATLRGRPVTVAGLEARPAAAAVLKSRGVAVPVARETRTAPLLEQAQLPELEDPAETWAALGELHRRTVVEEVTNSKADGVRAWRERWGQFLSSFQTKLLQSRHFDAHRRGENPRPRADMVREEEMRRTWNRLSDEERSDLIRRAAPRAFSPSEVFAAIGSWDALKAVAGLDSVERRIFEVVVSRLERDGTIILEAETEEQEPERFDVYDRDSRRS